MNETIDQLQLATSRATATVDLDGGRLASLAVDGLELLVTDGPKPTRWGSFPMIPWCGRLPFGRLKFGGETHDFPITSAPHANHGRTHMQAWERVDTPTPTSGSIRTDLVDPWPYGGHVIQRFDLTEDALTVTAEVHAGDRLMPAMIGWHPWFRRELGRGGSAELRFEADAVYALDNDAIPTGELVPVPEGPWDACFVGLTGPPVISWPEALDLTISSNFDHWVIYTQPEHAICVEPQSGPPNQFHIDPNSIRPGQMLAGSMTLRWG